MKKIAILSLVAVASLGLGACSKGAENIAETNETVIENATVNEAVEDVNAADMIENASNAVEVEDNATNAM